MRQNQIDRQRIEKQVAEYLKKGGKVTELPPFKQDMNSTRARGSDGVKSSGLSS